jgi:single-strand DNA-binding protein
MRISYEETDERKGVKNMSSVNKVILVGNLTRNPELKHTEGKKPVCIFGLATNRSWQAYDAQEKHEETEYHRIVAWDTLAETCHQYLRKGRKVHIEGRLHSRIYTDKDDVKREVTEIVLEELVMLDKMPEDVKESLEVKDASNGAPVQV